MIRILQLINEFSDSSSNRLIWQIVRGLDPARYRFWVGSVHTDSGPMQAQFEAAGARICHFHAEGQRMSDVCRSVRLTVDRSQIQIVHTHVLRPDLVGAWVSLGRDDVSLVSTKHNMSYPRGFPQRRLRNFLYWLALTRPHCIITVTHGQAQQLQRVPLIRRRKIIPIHNGIDVEKFYQPGLRMATRARLGIPVGATVCGYTGRLVDGKGLRVLLDAAVDVCASHPNSTFLLVGEGALRTELEARVQQNDLEGRVLFTGFRDDIPALLAAMDIFVLPSRSEGLPLSLMEAMAAGVACVTTAVGGVLELVDPGAEALLVPVGDKQALVDGLMRLMEEPAYVHSLGVKARLKAVHRFSLPAMLQAYDQAYQALTQAKGRRSDSVLLS